MGIKRKNAKGAGRPRVHATNLPIYDSMEQCAGATGVPIAALRHAKKSGCLFIRHGRVDFEMFIKWWFAQSTDENEDAVDWVKRDKRGSALLKEVKLEEEHDRVIDFAHATRFHAKLVNQAFFGELDRIANEFPSALKGKDEVSINEEVSKQIERIKASLLNLLEVWDKTKGKI